MRASRTRLLAAGACAVLAAAPQPASAAQGTTAAWSDGSTHTTCGPGLNTRTCSFTFYASGCTETGAMGVAVAGCGVAIRFDAVVTPIVQAGRVVGCRGHGTGDETTYGVDFRSTTVFSNSDIDEVFAATVHDVFADKKPGAVTVKVAEARETEAAMVWLGSASIVASCAPNQSGTWSIGGSGAVTAYL